MKKVLAATLLALSFTTGFTCSKQTPETAPPAEMPAPTQDEMAPPAEGTMAPPADGTMAPPADGTMAPAAPAEGSTM